MTPSDLLIARPVNALMVVDFWAVGGVTVCGEVAVALLVSAPAAQVPVI